MPKVRLFLKVTLGGKDVAPGEVVDLKEKSAASLVAEGGAEYVEEEAAGSPQDDETGAEGTNTLPDQVTGQEGAAEGQEEAGKTEALQDEAELEKLKAALDAKYKRDELAKAAKEIGVEFKYNAKNAEIIDAVVAAGKAEALLQA